MMRTATLFSCFAFLFALGAALRADAPQVSLETRSGRVLTGEVDDRSDGQTLWLRRADENIVLTSAIAWDEIVNAELGGTAISVTELADNLADYASSGPESFLTEYELRDRPLVTDSTTWWRSPPRVASIEADAVIANFDRTVESDGLLLTLAAIDTHGQFVSVRGSLSARLIVERLDHHTGQVSFEEFQRWTAPVSATDFRDGTFTVPLRYRRLSPEFDWQLCTAALLNVRLSVAGQGNYEASVPVMIHEFNPIRDELRNQQGSRFFRGELTHNTRQDGPRNLYRGYSPPRTYGF